MGLVACLDKDVVVCFDEGVVKRLYAVVVACLDNNNTDDFDV